ncbi:MAG: FKBP-type peptidyl-prolyl cis-trans isomerase, partial [Polaribacter sp.]
AVNIIKIGSKANSFDATTIFDRELEKLSVSEKERKAAETKADEARYSQYLVDKANFLVKMEEPKATKTASGLRILMLKKNASGKKINPNKSAEMHYTIYVADGKKIQSTAESKRPLKFTLNDPNRPMIAGFKEGVLTMREGEKARLFIPYYIGYGENAYGPFPKKADLVFEVELLSVEK